MVYKMSMFLRSLADQGEQVLRLDTFLFEFKNIDVKEIKQSENRRKVMKKEKKLYLIACCLIFSVYTCLL